MKPQFDELVRSCERILRDPPSTTEPPTYPEDIVRGSDPWRTIWWGNRTYTQKALNSAATLAFTRLLGGPESYGQAARRILLACAQWDPKGSTGYRYNDEAGMPFNYYFSRTYTFVNDLLTEEDRDLCRQVMKIRGDEMYEHLWPRHLWRPYSSHSNRAWHFLGEIAVAFHDEIDGTDEWLGFALDVFYNMYPVWSDDDGGWHEGASYWSSYLNRFTWWADIMREALDIDAYDKPYFSQAGYYAMYLAPPGKVGAGFGDLCAPKEARHFRSIVSTLAAQSQNGHWQWYVDQLGGSDTPGGYIGYIRGALPEVAPVIPLDLPASRLFRGIGHAYLNTQITNAQTSVQVAFKSSPFGTQSHGYEANNSFLLWAYGERLLIRSGYRDSYGSDHHRQWMWSTRSVNNITVDGRSQGHRSAGTQGNIVAFRTTPELDLVVGEAGGAYEPPLDQFTRAILFVKPDLMIVYDRLKAKEPAHFHYWLHALNQIAIQDQENVTVHQGEVLCDISFLAPAGLAFTQTDQYDPNPRPRITLREWHLTARTPASERQLEFVTLYRIRRRSQAAGHTATLERSPGGYVLRTQSHDRHILALLPIAPDHTLSEDGISTTGKIVFQSTGPAGEVSRVSE